MQTKKIEFKNQKGVSLSAKIDFPVSGRVLHYALFAHCFTCNKNLSAVRSISRALTQNGFAVLSFDFTGLGDSEGDFSDTNFSSNIADIVSAADFLKENFESPELLVGHSLGGAGVLYAANLISSVKAVATIGAPAHPEHIEKLFANDLNEIKEKGVAKVNIGGRPFLIKEQLLEDIKNTDLLFSKSKNNLSLLIMHSPQDKIVDISNARDIYLNAKHPKSFVSLDGADHLLSQKDDSIYAGSIISSWSMRYLTIKESQKIQSNQKVAVRTYKESFTTEIIAGNHSLIADEPSSDGGEDNGPSPYDLLLSSLGACTSMTLKLYFERKNWDFDCIEVHLEHSHIHSDDAKNTENPNGKIDLIKRFINVGGDLNEEQIKKILEIADKCPIHRTLNSPVVVDTEWLNKT